jgi:hypothetical protein
VDEQTDINNCGGCGTKCSAPSQACFGGKCESRD